MYLFIYLGIVIEPGNSGQYSTIVTAPGLAWFTWHALAYWNSKMANTLPEFREKTTTQLGSSLDTPALELWHNESDRKLVLDSVQAFHTIAVDELQEEDTETIAKLYTSLGLTAPFVYEILESIFTLQTNNTHYTPNPRLPDYGAPEQTPDAIAVYSGRIHRSNLARYLVPHHT